jgi:hypothetical protein
METGEFLLVSLMWRTLAGVRQSMPLAGMDLSDLDPGLAQLIDIILRS